MNSENKSVGRSVKRKLKFPKKAANTNAEGTDITEECTCFGIIRRASNGEVILPPGLFEEIDENFKALSESKYE